MFGAVHWKVPLRSPSPTYTRATPSSPANFYSYYYAHVRPYLLPLLLSLLLGASLLAYTLVAILAPLAIPEPLPFSIRAYKLPLSAESRAAWHRLSPAHRRSELVRAYDAEGTQRRLGLKIGGGDIETYASEMAAFGERYLRVNGSGSEPVEVMLAAVARQLGSQEVADSIDSSTAASDLPPLPRKVYTTAASEEQHLAPEFGSWAALNRGWEVQYFSDNGIRWWIERALSVSLEQDGAVKALPTLLDEFESLPRGVLKADFFRYLIILLQGGLYSDTDTSCILPVALWPGLYPSTASSVLDLLASTRFSMTASHAPPAPSYARQTLAERHPYGGEEGHAPLDSYNSTASSFEPPSLVVSIEKDAIAERFSWQGSDYTRGLQVFQWTLLARPFHPVMLDALRSIVQTTQAVREGRMADPGALDWTGPSMFSDAVFRYLLVRYGVHPQQLIGLRKATRVGDVLILPRGSFQSGKPSGYQGPNRVVWHGNHGESTGSWKELEGWTLPKQQ